MDPARQRAELSQPVLELVARLVEDSRQLGVGIGPTVRTPEREAKRHEPLLRSIVEVALEPSPFLVRRLDDPRPRRPDLLELSPQLGGQPRVLEGKPRRRRGAFDERRVNCRVVDQDRDGAVGPLDPGRVALVVVGRQLGRPAGWIDVSGAVRGGEREPQGRVVHGARKGGLEITGPDAVELAYQVSDRATLKPRLKQPDEERDRQQEVRELRERPRGHREQRVGADHAGDEEGPVDDERDGARPEDRGQRPTRNRRAASPTVEDGPYDKDRQHQGAEVRDRDQAAGKPLVRPEQQRVADHPARRVRMHQTLTDREEEEPGVDGDREAPRPAGGPAIREREVDVGEDDEPQQVPHVAYGPNEGVAAVPAQEVDGTGEPHGDHQRPDPVARARVPHYEADADREQVGGELDGPGPGVAAVRVRRHEREADRPDEDGGRDHPDRDRKAGACRHRARWQSRRRGYLLGGHGRWLCSVHWADMPAIVPSRSTRHHRAGPRR